MSIQDAKQAFLKKDRVIRGITEDGFFKIAVVKTTRVVKTAKERHELSLLSTVMLGKTMTAVMLLAADLKGEERVHARIEGNGPIGAIIAEANQAGEIRGYVHHPQAELDVSQGQVLTDGVGIGLLHFTKTLFNEARPITGTVALSHSNISGDFASYLIHSEQIPSAILLDVGIDEDGEIEEAGGILVQALPGAPLDHIEIVEQNLLNIHSLSDLLHTEETIDTLLHRALAPLPVKELKRTPVDFFCRCTRERFIDLLVTLGIKELKELKHESQVLVCHYCNEHYEITPTEIHALIQELQ